VPSALVASVWSFVANWGQQLISTGTFLFLAYQLQASDFGIVALAAAIVDLFTVIARFGQVEALLQQDAGNQEYASSSFWFLTAIGIGLSLIIVILGFGSAYIYDDPRVKVILFLLAPTPFIQNLAVVHEYHLRQRFEYRGIAVRNISATLSSGLISVVLAYAGFGYYALVAQKLMFTTVNAVALLLYYSWKPTFAIPARHQVVKLAKAGFDISASNMLGMANGRVIDLFVGHFLGVVVLGNLRIAWRLFDLLLQFTIQPVTTVAISSFTRLTKTEDIRASVLKYLGVLSFLCFPIFMGAAMVSTEIMVFILGNKWADAGWILGFLCVSAFALPVNYLFAPVVVSIKKTEILRYQSIMQLVFTTITVAISAQFSLEWVIIVHVARVYLFSALYLGVFNRYLSVRLRDIIAVSIGPVVAVIAMVACLYVLKSAETSHNNIFVLCFNVAIGGLTYLLVATLGEWLKVWRGNVMPALGFVRRKIGNRS
jgi:O-antigen/teichoic acid export membrane protein